MDEIDRLYELFFLWAFAFMAAGSLIVAKLIQRIGARPAGRGRIVLSYLAAPFGAFGALVLATQFWSQLEFAGMTIGTLLAMQLGFLVADLVTVKPVRVAEVFEDARPAARSWRWILVAWLLGLLGSYGLARLVVNDDRARAIMAETPADLVEAYAQRAAPEVMLELKRLFPADYQRILREHPAPDGLLALSNPPGDRRYAAWLLQIRTAVRAFIAAQLAHVVQAPDDALLSVARTGRALLDQFRPYPTLCAMHATGRSDPTDPATRQLASPAIIDAMETAQIAQLRAARGGLDQPTARDLGALRGRAQAALAARLSATAPDVAGLLGDPAAAAAATPDKQCRAVIAYYDAIIALPPELGTVILSDALVPTEVRR